MQDTRSEQFVHINGNGNGKASQVYSLPIIERTSAAEDEETINLRQLITIVKHRARLIGAVALGVTALAAIWTFKQEPTYRGNFQLLVEPAADEKETNKLAFLEGDLEEVDYETQIEVLQSPSVLKPILEKMANKYPEVEYDELIKSKDPSLKINQLKETKILEVTYEDTDPEKIKFVLDRLAQSYLRYSLQERQSEVKQGIDFVEGQLPRVRAKVDAEQEKLQKFRQKHNLLDPATQAGQLSQKLVELEERYFENRVKLNQTRSLYGKLQAQLGLQPNEALAASYLSEDPRYQNLLNKLQQVELELAKNSAIYNENAPVIQALEDKRAKLLPMLRREASAVLGSNYTESSTAPDLASPSSLRLGLIEKYINVANDLQVLEIRKESLREAIVKLNGLVKQMPVIARQYTDIQRQLNVATESLNRFLEAQETLQLEAAQQALPWRMISEPELPEEPIAPKPLRNLGLGLAGGLILGFAAALLAERLDPVFHSTEELKESIPLPILGFIPYQKELEPVKEKDSLEPAVNLPQLQVGDRQLKIETPSIKNPFKSNKNKWYSASPFLEAFRSLSTNIRLLGSDTPINSLVISSSVPSEGKSTISSHLAQAAAAMGQRVLLIDADLRRPQVHHWLDISNERGLSNVLATGLDLNEAIQKVPRWENLSVLPAGDIPPDPTRLLSSARMQQMMKHLQAEAGYDLIIYDTPPILGFADGRILATSTNGVILVVKMGKTDRSVLKQNIDTLKTSQVPILGLVANNASRNSQGSYHYYSKYYNRR